MLIVCKNESPPVITIFHFSPPGFPRRDVWRKKTRRDFLKHLLKGLKSSLGSLLQSAGIFPHGDFFPARYPSLEEFIQWQSIFSAFIHIYIVYGMDPAQILHVVVKKASKLYFRFTWSQTQRQIFPLCSPIPVFTVKLHLFGPLACAISLFTLQSV